MKINHSKILWTAAVTAFPLMVWPLLYASTIVGVDLGVSTLFRDADPLMAAVWFAACVIATWLGIAAANLRSLIHARNTRENPIVALAGNLMQLIPFIWSVLWTILFFKLELVTLMGLFSLIICSIYGLRRAFVPYADFLSRLILCLSLGFGVLGLLFIVALGMGYDSAWLIWPFFAEAVICAVAQNQGNIDFMMRRRKHDMRHLPKQVRWYNLMVTGGILALIFAVVIFRPQITWLFGRILDVFKFIIRYILLAILYLLGLQKAGEETPVGGSGDSSGAGMGDLPDGNGSPWWDYIMYTVIVLLVGYLLWTYRQYIIRAIRDAWRRVIRFIKDKLFSVPAVQKLAENISGGSEYYTDETEILTADEVREEKEETFRLRDWRRRVKKLSAAAPSADRCRAGYRLGLEWLAWKGIPIGASDTPTEILRKSGSMLPRDRWAAATELYQLVRYAEEDGSPEEQARLYELLLSVSKR